MARNASLARIVSVGALAVLTALGSLAVPTTASADKFKLPPCFPNCFGKAPPAPPSLPPFVHHHNNGWGYGEAALGGLAVGMIAAGAAAGGGYGGSAYGGDCFLVRRQAVDEFGNPYIRRVRVCQ